MKKKKKHFSHLEEMTPKKSKLGEGQTKKTHISANLENDQKNDTHTHTHILGSLKNDQNNPN